MSWELIQADCRAVLACMSDNSVDAVVTDPPYHLTSIVKRFGGANAAPAGFGTDGAFSRASRGFMGQEWDGGDIAFNPALWAEVLRVLKPGGHMVAFSGTRTYHRMACAIEDSGFEIRDQIAWVYGSGFPKSHDVSKALDKMAGAEREVIGQKRGQGNIPNDRGEWGLKPNTPVDVTAPATDAARQWHGWGTALKPAFEPICLARKPLDGTVAANVLAHGVGALNIDGCRIEAEGENTARQSGVNSGVYGVDNRANVRGGSDLGRFPANFAHDGSAEVVALFPGEAGAAAPVTRRGSDKFRNTYGAFRGNVDEGGSTFQGDSGSAARFFYCAKASKRDREEGLDHLPRQAGGTVGNDGKHMTRKEEDYAPEARANIHPTVKPTELMQWLCRLVTPPGGLVFDPFTGSGSTGKAALLEGFRFIGAEMTPEYIPIARARLEWAANKRLTG